MYLYGICLTELNINFSNVDAFLRSLIDTNAHDIISEYIEDMENTEIDPDETDLWAHEVDDWCDRYESEGYFGLDAVLKDIIRLNEDIDIVCDDPNGFHYLGISADAPWAFNQKTTNLSKEEFESILIKYIQPFTTDKLEFKYYHAEDGGDY